MAAGAIQNEADLLFPEIKVHGTTFGIYKDGLVVQKVGVFLSGRDKEPHIFSWDSITEVSLQYGCLHGTLHLKSTSGRCVSINGFLWTLRKASKVIFDMIHLGDAAATLAMEDTDEFRDVAKKLKRVWMHGNGVVLRKPHGLFGGSDTFFPWESVVSIQKNTYCCCLARVNIVTKLAKEVVDIENEPKEEAVHKNMVEDPVKNHRAVHHEEGPRTVCVSLHGTTDSMDKVFALVQKLMVGGKEDPVFVGDPQVKHAELTESGIRKTLHQHEAYIPWKQIEEIEFEKPLVGFPSVSVVDRIGTRIEFHGFNEDSYRALMHVYASKGQTAVDVDLGEEQEIIERGHVRITPEGISVPRHSLCATTYAFHLWSVIDAFEMHVTCGFGEVCFVTEGGERVVIHKSMNPFGTRHLVEILSKLRHLKYRDQERLQVQGGSGTLDSKIPFGLSQGGQKLNRLTNVSLRLQACKSRFKQFVCILDLDSVTGCELVRSESCCPKIYLAVYIDKRMGAGMEMDDYLRGHAKNVRQPQENEIMLLVRLGKDDQPEALRDEIMRRHQSRTEKENKSNGSGGHR